MKDANAVREPCVVRARIHELGKAKLAYAAQPLELMRVDQLPRYLVHSVVLTKDDEIVDRVAQSLRLQAYRHHSRRFMIRSQSGHNESSLSTRLTTVRKSSRQSESSVKNPAAGPPAVPWLQRNDVNKAAQPAWYSASCCLYVRRHMPFGRGGMPTAPVVSTFSRLSARFSRRSPAHSPFSLWHW